METVSKPKASRGQSQGSRLPRKRALSPAEIAATPDSEIDFTDIPELDEMFWREAELIEPDRTEQITLRVKRSVLDHFRAPGRGYQTRINQVLESYVRTRPKPSSGGRDA